MLPTSKENPYTFNVVDTTRNAITEHTIYCYILYFIRKYVWPSNFIYQHALKVAFK